MSSAGKSNINNSFSWMSLLLNEKLEKRIVEDYGDELFYEINWSFHKYVLGKKKTLKLRISRKAYKNDSKELKGIEYLLKDRYSKIDIKNLLDTASWANRTKDSRYFEIKFMHEVLVEFSELEKNSEVKWKMVREVLLFAYIQLCEEAIKQDSNLNPDSKPKSKSLNFKLDNYKELIKIVKPTKAEVEYYVESKCLKSYLINDLNCISVDDHQLSIISNFKSVYYESKDAEIFRSKSKKSEIL